MLEISKKSLEASPSRDDWYTYVYAREVASLSDHDAELMAEENEIYEALALSFIELGVPYDRWQDLAEPTIVLAMSSRHPLEARYQL